jgi:hypothetical protein
MRYRETFNLTRINDRIKLAKLLLDKAIEFKTEKIELEYVD